MDKEFYDKYINISEEEMIKGNIYGECRRMDKEDVYEWVYQDELKIKKQKEVIDKIKDLLTIKKSRCLNENDYILNAFDLDEILDILKEVSE